MSVLGKRLREAREKKGLTQIDASKKLGISNGTLSGYERNYRDPDTTTLEKMAELYEVDVDWLLGRSPKKEYDRKIIDAAVQVKEIAEKYGMDLYDPNFQEILRKAFEITLIIKREQDKN